MTDAPVSFPPWVPRAWREAFAPSLLCLWRPPPDPTLPVYWSAGLVAKKLYYAGLIRSRIPLKPIQARHAALRPYLELAAVRLIPWQRWKRYVTDCPACGLAAFVLLATQPGDPPFCTRCKPRRWSPVVTLLAALNAHHQLAPVPPPSSSFLRRLFQAAAALPPSLSSLTPLLSPALDPPACPRRVSRFSSELSTSYAAGWERTRRGPSVIGCDPLPLLARALHPVQVFLGAGRVMEERCTVAA